MLRVAVTGGIGSGKSTVAGRLAQLGAVVADSDRLAREVVAAGTPGLAAIASRFGSEVLTAAGDLDRAALAAIVFADPAARIDLERIIHPAVRARFAEIADAAPIESVVVNDIPLLVDLPAAAAFHLVVGVGADPEVRVRRLIGRGLSESDARARIAAQIDDRARRPLADAWLVNDNSPEHLLAAVERTWTDRLVPFNANLLEGVRAPRSGPALVPPDPQWPADGARHAARVALAAGSLAVGVAHIGSTAVPGLPGKDVVDLQLVVPDFDDIPAVAPALAAAGYAPVHAVARDEPRGPSSRPELWRKAFHANADPGRPVDLHIRAATGPAWRWALLFRDWLRADLSARSAYAELKARLAAQHAADGNSMAYAAAKELWWGSAEARAQSWADATGWTPP